MQLSQIQAKLDYYLEKYPNSRIALISGQRGAIEDDIKEFGKKRTYNFMSDIDLKGNLTVNDINGGNDIQQIQHSQDYNSDHDKTINIIFLFYEKQGAIRDCNGEYCYNAVGEATDNGDVKFCGDCIEEDEKQESVNCKNCGGSYRCSQCC